MDDPCKRQDTEFLHWQLLRCATSILFSQQVTNWVFLGFRHQKRHICYKATWSFGAGAAPAEGRQEFRCDGVQKVIYCWKVLLLQIVCYHLTVFLRASRTRMANVSLLQSLSVWYLSWNLECFCHSEHSSVFLNTINVNPFFTFLHCHQALEFMRDFILRGRTSWRSGGKEHVVNTKGINQAWLLSSGSCP